MSELPPPPPVASGRTDPSAPEPAVEPQPLVRRTPRAGELTIGWRLALAGVWCGVAIGFAAVWNASVQLGLGTWWLGTRSDPEPDLIRLAPFVPPVLMVLAALNHVRWLCWWGLGAATLLGLVAIGDLDRVATLAAVELAIAAAGGITSVAALAGTYRRSGAAPAEAEPAATVTADTS